MSEEFVFKKPDETTSEARDRLKRGEDTRTLPSRDDDDDNRGGSSGPSRAERRRRRQQEKRDRVKRELRRADEQIDKEIQELTTSSGAVDITNLDRFRELSRKRTQIRNELRTDTPEPIILSPDESLQQGASEAAQRKAQRLGDLTGKQVTVSRTVPNRRRTGEIREQLLNLERSGAISREQRQTTERELQNRISQETIDRAIRQVAIENVRRNANPGFRPAPDPEPIFGGNIPFITPLSEVFRNPLSSIDETEEERDQRVITQSDIPGLENAGQNLGTFTTRVRQESDSSLLRRENRLGLQFGRAGLDVVEGAGEILSRPFTVARGIGETVQTAVNEGVDEAIAPDNEVLAGRRLPFTLATELATLAVPATGLGLARGVAKSQRRLPRFLDETRSADTQSFTPRTIDPDTGQSQLVDQTPTSLDFRPVVDNGDVQPSVIGTRNLNEPRRFLFDPETGRVTPLSKDGPLGGKLADQRDDLSEVQVTKKQELDPATASEELVGSQRDTPVDVTGDVRTVQQLQKELQPEGQSLDSLVSQEEFILQNVQTGRTQTFRGDRAVDLLDTGRFTILDRKPTLRERTRQRNAQQQTRRSRQRSPGLQTSFQDIIVGRRGQISLPQFRTRGRGRGSQATRDVVEPRGTFRPARPDIDSVDTFRPSRGFGVRPPRLNPFGASLALQEQSGLLEPFDTSIPSLRDVGTISIDVEETAFRPVFDERSVQAQSDVFDTVQEQEDVLVNTFDTPTRGRITNTFDTPRRSRKRTKSKPGRGRTPKGLSLPDLPGAKGKQGKPKRVDVFVKRRGRFKKINTGGSLSFDEGQDLGAKVVSESPARTFKLEPSTSSRRAEFKGDPDFFENNKNQFRKSKSDRFGLVEKSEFAIDSRDELEGITFKGLDSLKRRNSI
jgi:hypothetical protein